MIVSYALGGGLGHLTRVRAFLHTLGTSEPVTVLTGSPHSGDPRVLGGLRAIQVPAGLDRAAASRWIAGTLRELRPDELVVDAFPAGIAGELTAEVIPDGTRTTHLARLLRWGAYRPLLPRRPVRFDRAWLVEPLSAEHEAALRSVSRAVEPLNLVEPPVPAEAGPGDQRPGGPGPDEIELARGAWLIVHTGPREELDELVAYARDTAAMERARPRLVLVTPLPPPGGLLPGVTHLDVYPAWPLFPVAARIITAAGCNAVRQAAPWRHRHRAVPFPRRYDDQFTRAARLADHPARSGDTTSWRFIPHGDLPR